MPATRRPLQVSAGSVLWRLPQLSWLALPLLAMPALWPLISVGLPQGLDTPNHLMRLIAFDQQIRAGNFYPRWMPNLVFGYGYPLINYYAPGTYYLAEAFRLAGLAHAPAMSAALVALVLLAGLGMWRLASDFFETGLAGQASWPALVAAAAYMYSPYLLTNVYARGAIAELGAQAALPWIVWSERRLLTAARPLAYVLPCALALAALALAHNLSLVMVAPVLVAYAALWWWRHGRPLAPVAWLAAAAAAAVGLSAFFWWPLLAERGFLADHVLEVARLWLPSNVWTWPSFLARRLIFGYNLQSPFPLGLVQVVLAVIGLAAARRYWNAEWLFLALLALLASLAIGRPTLPVWLSVSWLLIFQFPWRLLVLVSLPLALFAGATLLAIKAERWRGLAALALMGLIIFAESPRGLPAPPFPSDQKQFGPAAEVQFEAQTGSLGATTNYLGTTSDFMPRWVDLAYGLDSPPAPGEALASMPAEVHVLSAGPLAMRLALSAPRPATLRLGRFYFPGWAVSLDQQPVAAYPSTKLGLLTIDLPAGDHTLLLSWSGTPLQRVSDWVSLLTVAILAIFAWRVARDPWLAAAGLLVLLGLGGAALAQHLNELPPVTAPAATAKIQGLQLAGYRYQVQDGRWLDLWPYWFVSQTPGDLEFDWQLSDASQGVVAETRTRPYYDAVPTTSWRAGSLMSDAYRLGLPAGLPAGQYTLAVCAALAGGTRAGCAPQMVGAVSLATASAPADAYPATPVQARFGSQLLMEGYAVRGSPKAERRTASGLLVATPGTTLDYTLYWKALVPSPADDHGYLQLADQHDRVLAQQDKLLGPYLFPPRLWNGPDQQPDRYELTIPATAPSGVYWPTAGVYPYPSVERLPVHDAAGADLGSSLRLAPIKVLNPPQSSPRQPLSASFEGLGGLLGFDLGLPPGGLRGGGSFSVTLYYRGAGAAQADYTRFLHLYDPGLGMAGQADAPPQDGLNPTTAWLPGEVVADTAQITLAPGAQPGRYDLWLGFYDPATGARVPAADAAGQALPDDQVALTQVTVQP